MLQIDVELEAFFSILDEDIVEDTHSDRDSILGDEIALLNDQIAFEYECDERAGVEVEVDDTRSRNAINCSNYYRKDRSAQKRRVVINGMKNHGRVPALRTLRRWNINIHTAIDCYEHLKQKDPCKWEKIALKVRVLIANML